ncbi:TonB-dependent receptor [Pyrinomonas sp.]|uniref:TonB-dependent receptor n=1 Tax=Pyrinomonas sp. TaxID=2080306 RepID=UPI003316FF1C
MKLFLGIRHVCACLVLLFSLCVACAAQSQATTGNIEGRVLDQQEAVVVGATVTATNQQTGLTKSVTTDESGQYRLILLPPGSYTVRVEGSGFAPAEARDVVVTVGGKVTLDWRLSPGGVVGELVVTGEAPLVETTRTSVSSVVNLRAIENLPVSGRNYLDFATLTPGVIRDPTRTGDLAVGGQKGTLNNLQVDGVDNNNTFFGQAFGRTGVRPPYQFSEESVQEFQVNQNGFSAEFGRAGGAVINVVTRSGTNEFHGGAFEYFRDESLNANSPSLKATQAQRGLPNKRPPSQINQFGGRFGGPIRKNRAFFFFTYDGQRTNIPNPVEPPNFFNQPPSIQALLLPKLNTYKVNRNQDVYMLKLDFVLSARNQLSLRFNRQNFTGVNNEFTGPLGTEEHSGNSLARTTTLSGTLASTLSNNVLNEFRFQVARDAEPGTANSDQPEARIQTGSGFLLIGRNNFSPRETTIRRAQFIDNISFVLGRHNLKTGVDVNFDRIYNFFPGFFTGQYTFNSYADFAANRPSAFSQNFAGPNTSGPVTRPNSADYAAFVQDDWRATPRLTINAGLRYDYQSLAQPPVRNPDPQLLAAKLDTSRRPKDANNFAPRIGFAYSPDEKTVVRGGYGIFYGRTPAIMVSTAHSQNGINVVGVNLTSNAAIIAAGLTYPQIFKSPPPPGTGAPVRPNLFLFEENYVQPYVQQARLGVERELLPNTSLSVTYLFFRGVHLSRTRDINLFPPVETPGIGYDGQSFKVLRFPATRPFANYTRINLFESSADSLYNGLAVQLTRRFARGVQFIAAYTLAKAKDNKPDQTAVVPGSGDDAKVVENPFNLRAEWSAADVDQRQRFVFSPVFEFGRFTRTENRFLRAALSDYLLSGIIQLQSGFPYSAGISGDPNRDGNQLNDRVPTTRRNQFYTPATYQFDLRLARRIRIGEKARLSLIVEGFNLFNRANVATVNSTYYRGFTVDSAGTLQFGAPPASAAFGTPRTFLTPRELQLAIKFDF